MWKFLRGSCRDALAIGNKGQIRIFGTTYGTEDGKSEVDDADIFGTLSSFKEKKKSNLAANAKQQYNFLDKYEPNEVEEQPDKPWKQYEIHERYKEVIADSDKKSPEAVPASIQPIVSEALNKFQLDNHETHLDKLKKKFVPDEDSVYTDIVGGVLKQVSEIDSGFVDKVPTGKWTDAPTYGWEMLMLIRKKKLKEALHLLEVEMSQKGITPNRYCYNVVLSGCGKAGYTRKSFDLFKQMKDRKIIPNKHTFTSLFNACSNCPWPEEGLRHATKLRASLKDQDRFVTKVTYHAMMKAFGRCGDIATVFELGDEMFHKKHRIDDETISFLMQACVSDQKDGFRHALLTWKKMRSLTITPSIYTYNLLLRCIKECSAGEKQFINELLSTPEHLSMKRIRAHRPPTRHLQAANDAYPVMDTPEGVAVVEVLPPAAQPPTAALPDLLAKRFQPGSCVDVVALDTPTDRLALVGGAKGVLKNMHSDKIRPTAATFTYFVQSVEGTEAEQAIVDMMEASGVTPDVTFFNVLAHKRAKRDDYQGCQAVLEMMQSKNIYPDIVSYGCMALSCTTSAHCRQLLAEMELSKVRVNVEILTALVRRTVANRDYIYMVELLAKAKEYNVVLNKPCLQALEKARSVARNSLIKHRAEKSTKNRNVTYMQFFLMDYKHFLKAMKYRQPDHPWQQYGYDLNEELSSDLKERGLEMVKT